MRFVFSLVLAFTLTGCASIDSDQVSPEPTQSASAEANQTMEPMESETADPMESDESASSAKPAPTASSTESPSQSPSPTQTTSSLTLAEVSKRNTQSECWVVIDGGVYDLTDWIRKHPGGAGSISSLCGSDGTAQFTSKHGGEPRPTSTLESYYLGPLAG